MEEPAIKCSSAYNPACRLLFQTPFSSSTTLCRLCPPPHRTLLKSAPDLQRLFGPLIIINTTPNTCHSSRTTTYIKLLLCVKYDGTAPGAAAAYGLKSQSDVETTKALTAAQNSCQTEYAPNGCPSSSTASRRSSAPSMERMLAHTTIIRCGWP